MSNASSSRRSNALLKTSTLFSAVAMIGLTSVAHGAIWGINTLMSGLEEVPPNASPAIGILTGTYDDVTNQLSFNANWSGLVGPTTDAHFHGPAPIGANAGVQIGWTGVPIGATSGVYSNTFTLTATQETQLLNNLWYANIHSQVFPGGEIRGQLLPLIPEPGTLSLLGLAGVAALTRRR